MVLAVQAVERPGARLARNALEGGAAAPGFRAASEGRNDVVVAVEETILETRHLAFGAIVAGATSRRLLPERGCPLAERARLPVRIPRPAAFAAEIAQRAIDVGPTQREARRDIEAPKALSLWNVFFDSIGADATHRAEGAAASS